MPRASEIEQVRERLRTDWPFWAAHCAWILNDQRQKVRLIPRPWQARTPETPAGVVPLDEALEKQNAAGMPMRVLIGKARKLGMSTGVQSKFTQRVTQYRNEYALTVAQDTKTANVLRDMARFMYENLPTIDELGLGFSIGARTLIHSSNSRMGGGYMTFGDKLRPHEASVYETMTAGAKAIGRGFTPSMLHLSEAAHYDNPDVVTGLLNSVPKVAGTIVVIESTANGFNHFYDRWQRAVEGAEDPETGGLYVPLFYGWHHNPRNSLPFVNDQARDRFVSTIGDAAYGGDEEELELYDPDGEFRCTAEQLRWRRITMSEECEGKVDLFHQEHPATPLQMFIGSGNPVFSSILVSRAIAQAEREPAPVEGVVAVSEWRTEQTRSGTVRVPTAVHWTTEPDSEDMDRWGMRDRLVVWEHPVNAVSQAGVPEAERRPDGQYIVFADVAQGATLEDGDYSVIQVLDHESRMQVARYRSRIDIHGFPILPLLVALYYNGAWLAPEVTGLGIGVVDTLAKDYRYPRIYRRRRAGDDRRQDTREQLLGWSTDTRTKPLMEQTFGTVLKDGTHGLRDVATGREATTYIADPKRPEKHGARKGAFDDLLMAFMGAHHVAGETALRDPSKKRTRRVRGFDVSG